MTMVSSGPISLGGNATTGGLNQSINIELGQSATATISLNDSNVRTLLGKSSGAISLNDAYGKANQFAFTISSNQTNANLRTLAVNAGWNETSKVVATINSGVYISSNSTGTPGLTVNGSFPGGVSLINDGFIIGMGGAGGRGRQTISPDGSAGSAGGLALSVSSTISITNNGTIGGGGGGGGGGGAGSYGDKSGDFISGGGGGGGGRTGTTNSSGGVGGTSTTNNVPNGGGSGETGGTGTSSSAGGGGAGGAYAPGGTFYRGVAGGAGGSWGASGSTGGTANSLFADSEPIAQRRFGLSGGSAGAAVSGNSNISWVATGTRLGAIT